MKHILILGAGSAGTMMANHLVKKLDLNQWQLTVVDQHKTHYYQPGFLFIPFGTYSKEDVCKPKTRFLPKGVTHVEQGIDRVNPEVNEVLLKNGDTLPYDILILATGSKIVPEETEGMAGDAWRRDIFDFYTIEELAEIVRRNAVKLQMEVTDDAALEIAQRSRGTPRIANRLLRRCPPGRLPGPLQGYCRCNQSQPYRTRS